MHQLWCISVTIYIMVTHKMQVNFTFTFIRSGIIHPEIWGQQRTCRTTEEDIQWVIKAVMQQKHVVKSQLREVSLCLFCLFVFFDRILQMMSAQKTKWTICSFISINILQLLMVKDILTRYFQCLGVSVYWHVRSLSFGADVYIESFLKEWKNDYKRLERVHSYIQWYVCLRLCIFWLGAVWGYKINVILYWWPCSLTSVARCSAGDVLLQKERCKLSFFWGAKCCSKVCFSGKNITS